MPRIIRELTVAKYKMLQMDEEKPFAPYKAYQIGDKIYKIVPLYDVANNWIAVQSDERLEGKEVKFI